LRGGPAGITHESPVQAGIQAGVRTRGASHIG